MTISKMVKVLGLAFLVMGVSVIIWATFLLMFTDTFLWRIFMQFLVGFFFLAWGKNCLIDEDK